MPPPAFSDDLPSSMSSRRPLALSTGAVPQSRPAATFGDVLLSPENFAALSAPMPPSRGSSLPDFFASPSKPAAPASLPFTDSAIVAFSIGTPRKNDTVGIPVAVSNNSPSPLAVAAATSPVARRSPSPPADTRFAGSSFFASPTAVGLPTPLFEESDLSGRPRSASAPPARNGALPEADDDGRASPAVFQSPPPKQQRRGQKAARASREAVRPAVPTAAAAAAAAPAAKANNNARGANGSHHGAGAAHWQRGVSTPVLTPGPRGLAAKHNGVSSLGGDGQQLDSMSRHLKTVLGLRS